MKSLLVDALGHVSIFLRFRNGLLMLKRWKGAGCCGYASLRLIRARVGQGVPVGNGGVEPGAGLPNGLLGAWLYAAITDGYALPDSSPDESEGSVSAAPGSLPPPEHKETLSEAKKDAYVAQGIDEERFHRCPSGRNGPEERRFMYFDPAVGGPERRVAPAAGRPL